MHKIRRLSSVQTLDKNELKFENLIKKNDVRTLQTAT